MPNNCAYTHPIPSPALGFVGRKNSGKTTLLEKLITEISNRGYRVGSIKHHGHPDFDIDIPGKDSYRHREAGALTSAILSEKRFALVQELQEEPSLQDVLTHMPNHHLVFVEGFKKSNIAHFELFRADNERDQKALPGFLEKLRATNNSRANSMKDALPVGVITDIAELREAANIAHMPCFGYEDIKALADYILTQYARPKLSVVIQAGGESKRMGSSKALCKLNGETLIARAVRRLEHIADEIIVTTNEVALVARELCDYPKVLIFSDLHPQRGALQGLHTALHYATNSIVAVSACDMANISPFLLAEEAHFLSKTTYDACVPLFNKYPEPFAGVYRRETCLPALIRTLDASYVRMKDYLTAIDTYPFQWETLPIEGELCFMNINTPEDLEKAERLLGNHGFNA